VPLLLSILDETTAGERRSSGPFQFDTVTLPLREIIRLRVQQEVDRFNHAESEVFLGLVQPEETERLLNPVRQRRVLDWEKQYATALAAFQRNGFLVLVDDRQIADLDETIRLTAQTKVAFLKLVPLIGG
jgi:hypothetical protein